jgi:hypothetical protein
MPRRDNAIVAWHEVPGRAPPKKIRPVGSGVILAGLRIDRERLWPYITPCGNSGVVRCSHLLLAHPVVVVSPAAAGWGVLRVVTVFPVLAMRWFSLGLPSSPECGGLLRFRNRRCGCDYSTSRSTRPDLMGEQILFDSNSQQLSWTD